MEERDRADVAAVLGLPGFVTQIAFAAFLIVIAIVDAPGLHATVTRLRAWREGGT